MLSRIATCVVLLLCGCNTYLLDATKGSVNPNSSSIPPNTNLIGDIIDRSQIYTAIYAETVLTTQNKVDACSNYFVVDLIMNRQTTITLAAIQPLTNATNVPLPLLSVSKTGHNCTSHNAAIYVLPMQLLSATTNTALNGNFLYDVKSDEQVTKYLGDAVQLAGLLGPQGAAAFVTTATAVSQAPLTNDVKSAVNAAFSSSTDTTSPLIILIPNDLTRAQIQTGFDIAAHKIENNQIVDTVPLGTVTLTVYHRTTVLGSETTDLPKYGNDPIAIRDTYITTPTIGNPSPLFNLTNLAPTLAASSVENLPSNADAGTVNQACKNLRFALGIGGVGLNSYDTAAYLWAVYSQSKYSAHEDFTKPDSPSDCLSPGEKKYVIALKIAGWHASAPSADLSAAPTVPITN